MNAHLNPSPPGNEKTTRQGGSLKDQLNGNGKLPHPGSPSSPPLAIVRQHAATLKALSLPDFVRERLLAAIIKGDSLALAGEMLADEENGGRS